jgi:hypothetical protein
MDLSDQWLARRNVDAWSHRGRRGAEGRHSTKHGSGKKYPAHEKISFYEQLLSGGWGAAKRWSSRWPAQGFVC